MVVFAVAVLLTFNVFIDIGPILAGAGILGLAVSFGAQSLVKDVISGFFILFENQFAIGDVIEVAGKSGVVEKMTLRVVVLRDGEGIMHVVPNSEIKVVSNKTRGWSRAVVDVGVPYDENVDRALEVLRDEAAQFSTDKAWGSQLDGPVEVLGVESLERQRGGAPDDDPHPAGLAVDASPASSAAASRTGSTGRSSRFRSRSAGCTCASKAAPAGTDPVAHAAAGAAGG